MHDITKPLRLAVGSHTAGSGMGCAMNVISWENGDATITDLPTCSDRFLARVVQSVNDEVCTHRDGDLLCPDCSQQVIDLGHRTVGTEVRIFDDEGRHVGWLPGWSEDRIRRVYVEIALEEAESVARDDEDARVTECRRVTRAWLDGAATPGKVRVAVCAAYYAARAVYADYGAAADCAARAAADAHAAAAGGNRLQRAHRIIDRFQELTGITAQPVPAETTAAAVKQMMATS